MISGKGLHLATVAAALLLTPATRAADGISFERSQDSIVIRAKGEPLATYVFKHSEQTPAAGKDGKRPEKPIQRPYFKDLYAPGRIQVSRNWPPKEGSDPTDHGTIHPGLWLAFGDIGGADIWRNQGVVEHVAFVREPYTDKDRGGFTVRNRYRNGVRVICEETCAYTFVLRPNGYLILWDSTFQSDAADFHFGDQEEMGLGLRVATPLMVNAFKDRKNIGRILNDRGERGEKETWGKEALWCDYGGWVEKTFAGVLIMPDPANVRPCRWHTRSYGYMTANPFGCKVFGAGPERKTTVKKGEPFRLGFGVLIHAGAKEDSVDLAADYRDYVGLLKAEQAKP